MGTFRALPMPQLAGLIVTSAASAWGYGSWVQIIQTSEACSILGVTYQWTSIPSVDTTESHIFDIGTGAAGGEAVKIQVTSNHRSDTAVGYYLSTIQWFLPEPYSVSAGTRLAVRVADSSTSARTYQGFRLLIDQITPAGPQDFGNIALQAVKRSAVI
jgi:hypothetical protein